jgi:hypothetical protein
MFGCPLWLPLSQLLLVVAATSVVGGVWLLSSQLAVTASRFGSYVSFFWAVLVPVTAPTPHTTWRLLAVCPDMAEFLAVVTLREASLGSVGLYFDCNITKTSDLKDILGLGCPR